MKVIKPEFIRQISAAKKPSPQTKNDGVLEPDKILFTQPHQGDFFAKWISY
jgi:hypothetical protein